MTAKNESTGIVSWFNEAKGYGEIVSSGDIYFFSYDDICSDTKWKSIKPDAKVRFSRSSLTLFNRPKAAKVEEIDQ